MRQFLGLHFGWTSKYLGKFLYEVVLANTMTCIDPFYVEKMHLLRGDSMPKCQCGGTIEECKILSVEYV